MLKKWYSLFLILFYFISSLYVFASPAEAACSFTINFNVVDINTGTTLTKVAANGSVRLTMRVTSNDCITAQVNGAHVFYYYPGPSSLNIINSQTQLAGPHTYDVQISGLVNSTRQSPKDGDTITFRAYFLSDFGTKVESSPFTLLIGSSTSTQTNNPETQTPSSGIANSQPNTSPNANQTATTTPSTNATAGTNTAPASGGAEASIRQILCTPSDASTDPGAAGQDLYACINRMYRFSIAFSVIAAVLMIVVAGYLYMASDGNEESVTKAKGILVSSITALVILFIAFILLREINPELVKFKTIQPGFVSSSPGTNPIGRQYGGGGGSSTRRIVGGYNIGAYATDPNHEAAVSRIYNKLQSVDFSTAAKITSYMRSVAPSTPLTGEMVFSSAKKYNVDPKMIVAMMEQDSSLGTRGKGARTHNPGNVGNDDTGKLVDYGTWPAGVDAVAAWLSRHRA